MNKLFKITFFIGVVILVIVILVIIFADHNSTLATIVKNTRYSSSCEKMVAMQDIAGYPIPFKTMTGEKIYQLFFFGLNSSYPAPEQEPKLLAPKVVVEVHADYTVVCSRPVTDPAIKLAVDYGPRFSPDASNLSMGAFDSRENDLFLAIEKVSKAYFESDYSQGAKNLANDFFDQFIYLSEPGFKQFYYDLNPNFWQWIEKLTGKIFWQAPKLSTTSQLILSYNVYHDNKLVAIIKSEPGPVVSTATPPPLGQEIKHPFLTATALVPEEENTLYQFLQKAKNFDGYVNLLKANGYIVSLVNP